MQHPEKIGRYRIVGRLGAGAFGVVWQAHDDQLDTPVAIKVMAENWATHLDVRERFMTEARMLRRARSTGVVQVFDVGELPDERPYFVMEYAGLGTVEDRLTTGVPPLPEALWIVTQASRAAAELHEAGIVHRDIKPSNVLLAEGRGTGERVLLADLGLAKNLAQASGLTVVAGSAGYMSPEQEEPFSGIDGRADVYALGALLYHLVTGVVPGRPGRVLPAEEVRPGVPRGVRDAVERAMAHDREERWPTAKAFADALDALEVPRDTQDTQDAQDSDTPGSPPGPAAPSPSTAPVSGAGPSAAGPSPEPSAAASAPGAPGATGTPGAPAKAGGSGGPARPGSGARTRSGAGGAAAPGSGAPGASPGGAAAGGSTGAAPGGARPSGPGAAGARKPSRGPAGTPPPRTSSGRPRTPNASSAPPRTPNAGSPPPRTQDTSAPPAPPRQGPAAPGPSSQDSADAQPRTPAARRPVPRPRPKPAAGATPAAPGPATAPGAGVPRPGTSAGRPAGKKPVDPRELHAGVWGAQGAQQQPTPPPKNKAASQGGPQRKRPPGSGQQPVPQGAPRKRTPQRAQQGAKPGSAWPAVKQHQEPQDDSPVEAPTTRALRPEELFGPDPKKGRKTPLGRLKRGRVLVISASVVVVVAAVTVVTLTMPSGDAHSDTVRMPDSTGQVSIKVPSAWAKEYNDDGWSTKAIGLPAEHEAGLTVSQDAKRWPDLTAPVEGVFVGLSDNPDLLTRVNAIQHHGSCAYKGAKPYSDADWKGTVRTWSSCGSKGQSLEEIGLDPKQQGQPRVYVQIRFRGASRASAILGSLDVPS